MKKLLLPLLLCGLVALLLCACTNTPPPDETLPDTTSPVTEAPTEPATEESTEAPTDEPAEETTEAPTEAPTTEAPTEGGCGSVIGFSAIAVLAAAAAAVALKKD